MGKAEVRGAGQPRSRMLLSGRVGDAEISRPLSQPQAELDSACAKAELLAVGGKRAPTASAQGPRILLKQLRPLGQPSRSDGARELWPNSGGPHPALPRQAEL